MNENSRSFFNTWVFFLNSSSQLNISTCSCQRCFCVQTVKKPNGLPGLAEQQQVKTGFWFKGNGGPAVAMETWVWLKECFMGGHPFVALTPRQHNAERGRLEAVNDPIWLLWPWAQLPQEEEDSVCVCVCVWQVFRLCFTCHWSYF